MNNCKNIKAGLSLTILVMSLTACAAQNDYRETRWQAAAAPAQHSRRAVRETCNSCGVVSAVSEISRKGKGSGVGAVLGGLVGGLAGNQVGGGNGRKVATVAGVIGGAVVGNNIESNRNNDVYFEITVDMDSGGRQILEVANTNGIGVGSKVNVDGDRISLR